MPHVTKLVVAQPNCLDFPCREECCSAGSDVWPVERDALIAQALATEADFVGPYVDGDGDTLYRTALGPRGCIFLMPQQGCRLHHTGFKPEVCVVAPRDAAEADELDGEDMLPCRSSWQF